MRLDPMHFATFSLFWDVFLGFEMEQTGEFNGTPEEGINMDAEVIMSLIFGIYLFYSEPNEQVPQVHSLSESWWLPKVYSYPSLSSS